MRPFVDSFGENAVNLKDVWKEQSNFNEIFRKHPLTFEEKSHVTQHLVLCVMSELNEILSTIQWKQHRKTDIRPNPQQTLAECIDVFKYLVSIAQVWDFSDEDFFDAFWKKSMVVRQRYSEEWIKSVQGKTAIIDIDGVLCDYQNGFSKWLMYNHPDLYLIQSKSEKISRHSLKLTVKEWQSLKHDFRISGEKENLPAYVDAQQFLKRLEQHGIVSVLLTSRPIDRYPNLYADTVSWLKKNNLPYDIILWSHDKADAALDRLSNPVFAVDDDPWYINKYASANIPSFWVNRKEGFSEKINISLEKNDLITEIPTLSKIAISDY